MQVNCDYSNFKNICFIEPEKIYLITFHLLGIQQSLNKIP